MLRYFVLVAEKSRVFREFQRFNGNLNISTIRADWPPIQALSNCGWKSSFLSLLSLRSRRLVAPYKWNKCDNFSNLFWLFFAGWVICVSLNCNFSLLCTEHQEPSYFLINIRTQMDKAKKNWKEDIEVIIPIENHMRHMSLDVDVAAIM